MLFYGKDYIFDSEKGVLAIFNETNFKNNFLISGPVSQLFGQGGYTFSLLFAPAHIVGNFALLEPIFGQILGVAVGLDVPPTLFTYLGGAIIVTGLYFISRETAEKVMNDSCLDETEQELV